MSHVIKDFQHRTGVHCGSTALMNVMCYSGHEVSEAFCFGIGSGLGFVYYHDSRLSPSYLFNGRARNLETSFFEHMEIPFRWREGKEFPWAEMKAYLDRDVPILLLTDLYYLEYYKTKTHFSGHGVVLVGYDEAGDNVFLSDTERPGLQKTSLPSLAQAMVSQVPPYPISNFWHPVEEIPAFSREQAMRKAIRKTVRTMLSGSEREGLPAMKSMLEHLPYWGEAEDWKWCARFGYQVIEKRGTGGSAFRGLYQQFLKEASSCVPEIDAVHAVERMERVARQWSDFASILYRISEGDRPQGFEAAAESFRMIIEMEGSLFADLHQLMKG